MFKRWLLRVIERLRPWLVAAFVISLFLVHCELATAQSPSQSHKRVTPPVQPAGVRSNDLADIRAKEEATERGLDSLATRVDSELKAADERFDAVARSTDRAFTVLALLGALGSFLGGLIVFATWLRSRKVDDRHRQDYERERQFYEANVFREREFYEARALDIEKRHAESHALGLELARKSAEREATFALQQFQLGENFLARSGDMLSKQIEGMEKLGGVIELVKKTFDMQLTRVGDVDRLVTRLTQTDEVVGSFTNHFRNQYHHVRDLITTFKNHSRMAWTRLTNQEEAVATRALTTFETIPNSVLDAILTDDNGRNRYELASAYQLLGVSAYYTNDVDIAFKYLEQALKIYGADDAPAEDLFPQAFCSHFFGLVEKNWCHLDRPLEANLASARRHLEDAARRLQTKKDEFLTPLTLAEVLSYSEQSREAARTELDKNIARLEKLKDSPGLDTNQDALFSRALLMRGNIDYLDGDFSQALIWYSRSYEHNSQNAYALLSMAQASVIGSPERVTRFRDGLQLLENPSGPLNKRETSVRVSALAWAVTAAHEAGDELRRERYAKELGSANSYARPVGHRVPLFFCPLFKTLVTFEQLRDAAMKQGTRGKSIPHIAGM